MTRNKMRSKIRSKIRNLTLVLVCLVGCGPNPKSGYRVGNVEVFITDITLSSRRVRHLLEAVELQTASVEADFNYRLPPTKLFVQTQILNSCDSTVGGFAGCNYVNGTIVVWSNGDDTCEALYHEYGHTLFGLGHTIWVWPYIDNRRGELAAQLRTKWLAEPESE